MGSVGGVGRWVFALGGGFRGMLVRVGILGVGGKVDAGVGRGLIGSQVVVR